MLGLILGKQIGVFGAIWGAVAIGLAPKPAGASWPQLYGAAILCGIGFTMSLFIGGLAWPARPDLVDAAKIGTLTGSLIAAIAGYLVLRSAGVEECPPDDEIEAARLFACDEPRDMVEDRSPAPRNLRE